MKKRLIIGLASLGLVFSGAIGATAMSGHPAQGQEQSAPDPRTAAMLKGQEAKEIALNHVGDGKVVEMELDRDDGRTYYELEIQTTQGKVEVDIDAYTGRILKVEWDEKRNGSKRETPPSGEKRQDGTTQPHPPARQSLLDLNEAANIALNHVGDGIIVEIELDTDDGRTYYEIELDTARGEVEVEVDAYTGAILEVEWDD